MTKYLQIKKAGVLGAGTMGSGIAAHLANCGIEVLLLDIVPPEFTEDDKAKGLDENSPQFRNRIATDAIKAMPKMKLCPLYDPADAELITAGNTEDHFDKLSEVDWVIEAVFEKLDIKRFMFQRLESIHHEGQIISSNTSGISLSEITDGRGKDFLSHVFITHFFNPPRYMHLMELVAGKDTDTKLFEAFADFTERVLGKGVVVAKDTSNFIGNRIGFFDLNYALHLCRELNLSVKQADAVAGPLIGRPKSGIFRLLDIIGIDITTNINANLFEASVDDEQRQVFKPNPLLAKMIEKGLLGNKTGSGFYRKSKDENSNRVIESLDLDTLEYSPCDKIDLEILNAAKKESDFSARLKILLESDDAVGTFTWGLLSNTLCYAANRIPQICDNIIGLDNALKWGFNWQEGPFTLWDIIGVEYITNRLKKENRSIPPLVTKLLESGLKSFYSFQEQQPTYFDSESGSYQPEPQRKRVINLTSLKKAGKIIKQGQTASIIDLGDDIICLQFHSKANALNSEVIETITTAAVEAEKNYRGLVIGNQGTNFSLGADLKEMAAFAQNKDSDGIAAFISNLQHATMALKYCCIPTVAAVHNMVLGGGCETVMHCDRIQAAPETYIGLVELSVGLIPAGGGSKEMAIRCSEWINNMRGVSSFALMNKIIEMLGYAKTSASAADAKKMGYLRPCDGIVMNKDSVIYSAKKLALQLWEKGYRPPVANNQISVLGRGGIAEFKVRFNMLQQGNFISEYDEFILNQLVYVLCGGDVPDNSKVTEQYMLDLEREVFVSMITQQKTLERIEHTLKTGKPLRN
jgi:3-hydroxyacyl-CoA dehydrogenase